ncbi:virulence-associated V antigen [Vibrio tubiashii]|uniref:virulence-associated V antigen n=1 Tax=Vibrio tubiashii TaxID=29498 RepID=UPI001EFC77ED|nr:virulence-associated V antigen [Vibrio tubiashii]MCG9577595.1 virulence-associated V antigen [Vibrio tubiashii]
MTDMRTTTDLNAVATSGTGDVDNPQVPLSFQAELEAKLKKNLSEDQYTLIAPLLTQLQGLPPINGLAAAEEIAQQYAIAIETLIEKQSAFSDMPLQGALTQWIDNLKAKVSTEGDAKGTVAQSELNTQLNITLATQFESWFTNLLNQSVGPGMPTEFIRNIQLTGSGTLPLAEQMPDLDAAGLKSKTEELSTFFAGIKARLPLSENPGGATQYLRAMFERLGEGPFPLSQLLSGDILLTEEQFTNKVTELLQSSLLISKEDAEAIAGQFIRAGIGSMSITDLESLFSNLDGQVDGMYAYAQANGQLSATVTLAKSIEDMVALLKNNPTREISISAFFAGIAKPLTDLQIDTLVSGLKDQKQSQVSEQELERIKESAGNDIEVLFQKYESGQDMSGQKNLQQRYETLTGNLAKLKARLGNVSQKELDDNKILAEHALSSRDLLSITDASLANRFDEQVLLALNERRVNRLEKRNEVKGQLQDLTGRLKVFGEVQSKIHTQQSNNAGYNPAHGFFSYDDFGYSTHEQFINSPEYTYLQGILPEPNFATGENVWVSAEYVDFKTKTIETFDSSDGVIGSVEFVRLRYPRPNYIVEESGDSVIVKQRTPAVDQQIEGYVRLTISDTNIPTAIKAEYRDTVKSGAGRLVSHMQFLRHEGVDAQNKTYQNEKDEPTYLTDFSSSISDKSKLLNDEVQIKTTTLNDLSSQYNSTVEAMNKFVQKYHSILEQILRAI